ncbi:MAG TPA: BON domain-containing protein [Candidatus Sulfotelmatobacter sp.]|nr:BON domain-containing protein [Candidatus Sulfotelmatobacter sp.]
MEITNTDDPRHLKLDLLELRDEEIKAELKQNSEIIRRKPRDIGDSEAGPDSDNRALSEIKGKFKADPKLLAYDISVNCAHGHVALIGTVSSVTDVGQAIAIALESGGVRDVTSTLQVKTVTNDTQTINP